MPDGQVLVTGGTSGANCYEDVDENNYAVRQAEMWTPPGPGHNGFWSPMDSQQEARLYHSVALLLPDARVLSAGGGRSFSWCGQGSGADYTNHPTAEVYSPPYLFNANGTDAHRPNITNVPEAVYYNSEFTVRLDNWDDARDIATGRGEINMVRLPSVTHSFDQNQHFNRLEVLYQTDDDGLGVRVKTTWSWAEMPPGHYMLFALVKNPNNNDRLTPSKARIIKVVR